MIRTIIVSIGIFSALVPAFAAQLSNTTSETPFFCNLKALTAAERAEHEALGSHLAAAVVKIQELSDGYAFQLSDRLSIRELAAWCDFERRCCPFFDFSLELARENGPATLSLTGRNGVKAFIKAEFAKIFR